MPDISVLRQFSLMFAFTPVIACELCVCVENHGQQDHGRLRKEQVRGIYRGGAAPRVATILSEQIKATWILSREQLAELRTLRDVFPGGSCGGAVVRALASHQCVPGSIPGPGVICGLSLLLVLALAPRVFLRVLRVLRFSSLLKNQHL